MLAIIGLGTRFHPNENATLAKRTPFAAFAPHLVENPRKRGLEDERWGRRKPRKQGRGSIEDRPSADIAAHAAVDHGLAGRGAAEHRHEPPALLELAGERMRYDLARSIDEDDIVRGTSLPALRQRTGHDCGVAHADGREIFAREASQRLVLLERDHGACE